MHRRGLQMCRSAIGSGPFLPSFASLLRSRRSAHAGYCKPPPPADAPPSPPQPPPSPLTPQPAGQTPPLAGLEGACAEAGAARHAAGCDGDAPEAVRVHASAAVQAGESAFEAAKRCARERQGRRPSKGGSCFTHTPMHAPSRSSIHHRRLSAARASPSPQRPARPAGTATHGGGGAGGATRAAEALGRAMQAAASPVYRFADAVGGVAEKMGAKKEEPRSAGGEREEKKGPGKGSSGSDTAGSGSTGAGGG